MTEYEDIRVEIREPLAWVTIDRPAKLNTLRVRTLEELYDASTRLEAEPAVKVVVITGAGERAFSAGIDVNEMVDHDGARSREFTRLESRAYRSFFLMQKPCVAAVNGYALGGGCVLALTADIRIASESATFGLTELNMGAPVPIEASLLPALVGHGRAREIVYTARHVPASEALDIGLCTTVVPAERLAGAAEDLALSIARHDALALSVQKDIMNHWLTSDPLTASDYSIDGTALVFGSGSARDAITSFVNRRR